MTFSIKIFSLLKSFIFPSEWSLIDLFNQAKRREKQNHIRIPRDGTKTTPAHRFNDFTFRSYAPVAFRHFRELFNIKPDEFLHSICNPLRELKNPGASGSLFYLTSDDEFILKTVQKKEAEFLKCLLPGYYMVRSMIGKIQLFSSLSLFRMLHRILELYYRNSSVSIVIRYENRRVVFFLRCHLSGKRVLIERWIERMNLCLGNRIPGKEEIECECKW